MPFICFSHGNYLKNYKQTAVSKQNEVIPDHILRRPMTTSSFCGVNEMVANNLKGKGISNC